MFVQVALEGEGFSATAADVRFLGRVCLYVGAQVRLIRECLGTLWTPERLLASVRSDVTLQEPRSAESLAAVRTGASLVVSAYVHAVGWHRDVFFVAVRALSRLAFSGDTAVRLTVPGQVARCAILLAAIWAYVKVH